jgi:hypothetical protein
MNKAGRRAGAAKSPGPKERVISHFWLAKLFWRCWDTRSVLDMADVVAAPEIRLGGRRLSFLIDRINVLLAPAASSGLRGSVNKERRSRALRSLGSS